MKKSRLFAAFLAIFLGGLGIHKFYLGRVTQGIFYLIFSVTFIPFLLGIIQGFGYLLSTDEFFYEWNVKTSKQRDKEYMLEKELKLQEEEEERLEHEYLLEKRREEERIRKKERLEMLTKKYGVKYGQRIFNKNIWQGMSNEMLFEAIGQPASTKEKVMKTKTSEKFYYYPYRNNRGNLKFKKEVGSENGKVVSWKDL